MRLLTAAAIGSFLCSSVLARTLHVSPTGIGTDGLSWETALTTVQSAMVAASSGDHVWVRSATYAGNIRMTTGVSLFGGFVGTESLSEFHLRDWKNNPTVLSGGTNVITAADETTIDGFVVRDGVAYAPGRGGGILVLDVRADISNCLITNNGQLDGNSTFGIGIFCEDATIEITNCSVQFNRRGMAFRNSSGEIRSSTISRNISDGDGGGLSVSNSVTNRHLTLHLSDCLIVENRAETDSGTSARGGGIFSSNSNLVMDRCVIARNVARGRIVPFGGGSDGGAIYSLADVNATLTNCLIEGNEALRGSVFSIGQDSIYRLNSCTLFSNEEVSIDRVNELWMSSSILYSNAGVEISGTNKRFISFSNVKGGAPGIGNIDADPLFLNTLNSNLRLQVGSPCIDSGSMDGPSTDLDGSPRPFDVPGIGRDGPGAFDMGAYEFIVPTPAPTLVNDRSDVNRSGEVNAYDLLILIADWKKTTGTL